ncbi:50S ribosomal protein L33 [Rhodococcus hoagii]|nr:50S ribosomal protein L33 [Prescottella equi]
MAGNEIRPLTRSCPRRAPDTATTPEEPTQRPERLVLRRYDPVVRRHVDFREER